MPTIIFTASGVAPVAGANLRDGQLASAAFNAGAVVRRATDGRWLLAQANNATNAAGEIAFAVSTASGANQVVSVQNGGRMTCNGLTPGMVYCLAADQAGGIAPYADLVTGNRVVILGVASSATELIVNILNTGVAKP